jgi:hypothetical protein
MFKKVSIMIKHLLITIIIFTQLCSDVKYYRNDLCFNIYAGADIGVGTILVSHQITENVDLTKYDKFQNSFQKLNLNFNINNSNSFLTGGGRLGISLNNIDCTYFALEFNAHTTKQSLFHQAHLNGARSPNFYSEDVNYITCDKLVFILGSHAHLGFKFTTQDCLYLIVGYKFLKSSFGYDLNLINTTVEIAKLNFSEEICHFKNNGLVLGLGSLFRLCDWDVRLEAIYVKFKNKSSTDSFSILKEKISKNNEIIFDYKLLYSVLSLAYNF